MSTLGSWYYQITVPSVTATLVVHSSADGCRVVLGDVFTGVVC